MITKQTLVRAWTKATKAQMLYAGVLLGVLGFVSYKMATYTYEHTHYHANFAFMVEGEQEQFETFSYYEELTGCSSGITQQPAQRAHMHKPDNDVIHIHDEAVTWGNFLENIGISAGPNHVAMSSELYTSDGNNKITYILNGKSRKNVAFEEIRSEDRLLIMVGSSASQSEPLEVYERVVASDAPEFNAGSDPGTCSSNESHGFTDRLKEVF